MCVIPTAGLILPVVIRSKASIRSERSPPDEPMQEGTRHGIELYYINPSMFTDSVPVLLAITNEKGYDDVFVYAPPKCVAEIGNRIMAMAG